MLQVLTIFLVFVAISDADLGYFRFKTCPDCPYNANFRNLDIYNDLVRQGVPSNGLCPPGKDKYILRGILYGNPGVDVCTCLQEPLPSKYKMACPPEEGVPVCPNLPILHSATETLGHYFLRVGAAFKGKSVPDGCCPSGLHRTIVAPALSGLSDNLCYCWDMIHAPVSP